MNIQTYNCLTADIAEKPNYKPNPLHRRIEFYYTDDDRIIIIGFADNNYIYWLSVTKLEDTDINCTIFDHISQHQPTVLGHVYTALRKTDYTAQNLRGYYHDSLILAQAHILAEERLMWLTPFVNGGYCIQSAFRSGYSSSPDQIKYHGRSFANDLRNNYGKLKQLCRIREANGMYIDVMRHYLHMLSKCSGDVVADYAEKQCLMDLIRSEKYLLCSDNKTVRELYMQLDRCCAEIYNAYMSAVR